MSAETKFKRGHIKIPAVSASQRPSSPETGMAIFNTSNGNFEVYNGTTWDELSGNSLIATGGKEVTYTSGNKNYKVHRYEKSGFFHIASGEVNADVFMVGGGGGGSSNGAGGGAGGVINKKIGFKPGAYAVTVGAAGTENADGSDSIIKGNDIEEAATGGGGGSESDGGSASGAEDDDNSASSVTGQGNDGGDGFTSTLNMPSTSAIKYHGAGGGGGGGGAGGDANLEDEAAPENNWEYSGGTGGAGVENNYYDNMSRKYAGGGGGGGRGIAGGAAGDGGGGGVAAWVAFDGYIAGVGKKGHTSASGNDGDLVLDDIEESTEATGGNGVANTGGGGGGGLLDVILSDTERFYDGGVLWGGKDITDKNLWDGGVGWLAAAAGGETVDSLGAFGGTWTNTGNVSYGSDGHLEWEDGDNVIQHISRNITLNDGETLFLSLNAIKGTDETHPAIFSMGDGVQNAVTIQFDPNLLAIYTRIGGTWTSRDSYSGSFDFEGGKWTANIRVSRSGNSLSARATFHNDTENLTLSFDNVAFTILPSAQVTIGGLPAQPASRSWDNDIWQVGYLVDTTGASSIPSDTKMESFVPTDKVVNGITFGDMGEINEATVTNTGEVVFDGTEGKWINDDSTIQHLQSDISLADGKTLFLSMKATDTSYNAYSHWFTWGDEENAIVLGQQGTYTQMQSRINETWSQMGSNLPGGITLTDEHILNIKLKRSGSVLSCRATFVQGDTHKTIDGGDATFTTLPEEKLTIGFLLGLTATYSWNGTMKSVGWVVLDSDDSDLPTDTEMQTWSPGDGWPLTVHGVGGNGGSGIVLIRYETD